MVALMPTACLPSTWGPAVETVIKEKQAASDAEATLVIRAPCMMTVGALMRQPSKSDREAVATLCGGDRDPKPTP